jgi:type VI protein secretion system component Hcp
MTATTPNTLDRELTDANCDELLDSELDTVTGSITITRTMDKSSPLFFKNCCAGSHYS